MKLFKTFTIFLRFSPLYAQKLTFEDLAPPIVVEEMKKREAQKPKLSIQKIEKTPQEILANKFYDAVTFNKIKDIKKYLEMDIDIYRIGEAYTPFNQAINLKYYEILKIFLVHGANPNHKTDRSRLALRVAGCNYKMIKLLLEHGANPNLHTVTDYPVMDWHIRYCKKNSKVITLLNEYSTKNTLPIFEVLISKDHKALNKLLSKKIDLEVQNRDNETPLFIALKQNDLYAIEVLLKHKANPHHANKKGFTPLIWIVAMNRIDALKIFIKYKVNLNHHLKNFKTPLCMAMTSFRSAQSVKLLLEHGASPYRQDKDSCNTRDSLIAMCKSNFSCDEYHSYYRKMIRLLDEYEHQKEQK